jgi:glycosyltransferase involved in cell wall biosynthesis
VLIENSPGSGDTPVAGSGAGIRQQLGIEPDTPVVLYTGTFEAYQGLDLLFESMAHVSNARPDARLLLAGGKPEQVEKARAQALSAGIGAATIFAGERPASEIPAYLLACDVLVSPRSRGTNTPLKIYQYLRSGKAIVATRLMTHTQVLSDDTSILTGVSAREFGDGILLALSDRARAAEIGANAQHLAETKYSYEAYLDKTRRACAQLFDNAPLTPGSPVKDVA